ncbi:hypothetical protein [Haloglycomyces albus]|uniref:hypothetical protein n=1 Tax=Haloglycomyces albus TaxID=526067 RepID=UPI00046D3274|nr:hypothetical protein [Haloglycomyces albus]
MDSTTGMIISAIFIAALIATTVLGILVWTGNARIMKLLHRRSRQMEKYGRSLRYWYRGYAPMTTLSIYLLMLFIVIPIVLQSDFSDGAVLLILTAVLLILIILLVGTTVAMFTLILKGKPRWLLPPWERR